MSKTIHTNKRTARTFAKRNAIRNLKNPDKRKSIRESLDQ